MYIYRCGGRGWRPLPPHLGGVGEERRLSLESGRLMIWKRKAARKCDVCIVTFIMILYIFYICNKIQNTII